MFHQLGNLVGIIEALYSSPGCYEVSVESIGAPRGGRPFSGNLSLPGCQSLNQAAEIWRAVKELKLSFHASDTIWFAIDINYTCICKYV